jgi:hypothetical protein
MTSTAKDPSLHLELTEIRGSRRGRMHSRLMVSAFIAALMAGCAQAPDHSSAWLSYKYGLTCGDVTACTDLRKDDEADEYYKKIGAEDSSNNPVFNLNQWKQQFGIAFNSPAHAVYANKLDLQLGRDMNCVEFQQPNARVVCYVTNYGPAPFDGVRTFQENPNWPNLDQAINDALVGDIHNSFATVAMVYDSVGIGANNDKVAFYVFGSDPADSGNQILVKEAALDGEGGKTNPRMCMACHGGSYDTTAHSVTGANFLPFDVQSFYYGDAPHDLDGQQEAFRQLNTMVLHTNPNQPIQNLVHCLYSFKDDPTNNCRTLNNVNVQGATVADDTFVPADWAGDKTSKNVYKHVFRNYCRMCHIASAASFETFSSFNASSVDVFACSKKDMPHAEVPFGGLKGSQQGFGLWKDGTALSDLRNFLNSVDPKACQ